MAGKRFENWNVYLRTRPASDAIKVICSLKTGVTVAYAVHRFYFIPPQYFMISNINLN